MLKVQVEGQMEKVQPFLSDLKQRSQIELLKNETKIHEEEGIRVICYVDHNPEKRVKTVQLSTIDGNKIQLPLMDLIQVEMDKGKKIITGRSFDIFGS
ncbi:hypothetical protein [Thermoactinomyces mirandus]|uniref:Uncharacterized protein n=1 Tax=Thermoactinomyces mirandus TaxID=2756294 RepID=A0A7W1XRG0_9BACL|nr:hypothetical protein [Thermoactinomyces mirandus]MBA4601770.1 hypothetical protein [Thermoactinomyces mirandus]